LSKTFFGKSTKIDRKKEHQKKKMRERLQNASLMTDCGVGGEGGDGYADWL
jgi:hypothetical protein